MGLSAHKEVDAVMGVDRQKLDRVRRRVAGLRALAANNPSEHESQAAVEMADKLAMEYGLESNGETYTRGVEAFRDMTAEAIARMMRDLRASFAGASPRAARAARDFHASARSMADIFGDSPTPVSSVGRSRSVIVHEVPTNDDTRNFRWNCPDCGAGVFITITKRAMFDAMILGGDVVAETFDRIRTEPVMQRCHKCAEEWKETDGLKGPLNGNHS